MGVTCRNQFLVQNCVDIGEGGMLLRVFSNYKTGDQLEVSLFINNQFATTEGEVVYTIEPQPGQIYVGIKFSNPPAKLQTTIREYVGSN